jgi:ubiquinone/menaquinone biosynthesis C-methylase UbiE
MAKASHMEKQLEEIRDAQKASWNKFSGGWKKWDNLMMDFLGPMGDAIVRHIALKGDEKILDIAAGTGEPGLTIAEKIKQGHVTITDLSDDMLAVAKEHAVGRNIRNVDYVACDVSELPFSDNYFDAISCRFGFMFFPDMLMAAREMRRVLKRDGRMATSVWAGPEKNFWVTAIGGTITQYMQLPAPPPEAPGMFRCADSEKMKGVFETAGFRNIQIEEVKSTLHCGTTDTYWDMMTEVAAPFVAALSKADEPMKKKIKEEVFRKVAERYPAQQVFIEGTAWIISAEK